MPKKLDGPAPVRLVGLWASIVAVVAFSVTVLADNHSAGFGRVVPREEQLLLLMIAALLFAVQAIGFHIHRAKRASTHTTVRTRSAAPSAKKRS